MLAFSEALVLGETMGMEREKLFGVLLNAPVVAPFLKLVQPKLENGDFSANFPLRLMQKDLQLAAQTAYECGIAMPSLNATKETYALAKQSGLGEVDFSAIYKFLNQRE